MADVNIGAVYESASVAEDIEMAMENYSSVQDGISVAENIGAAVSDSKVSKVEAISLAEYVASKVGNPSPSVNDGISAAEDINMTLVAEPHIAEVISLAEYIDVTVGGEGPQEVTGDTHTEDEITAVGIFTKGILPMKLSNSAGYLNISISGSFTGTVALQRSFDNGVTWHNVATYTDVIETSKTDKERGVRYRLGCPTTWTSGTALCRLGTGG
jgi:hypothetical protein